jgi:hypothetical protein
MATHLGEVELIDLRKSTLDKEHSDTQNGVYRFKKEVIAERGITRNPNWKHKWGSKLPAKRFTQNWEAAYGAEKVGVNPYIFPKGAVLDENGHWVYGDAILMRIPLETYVDKIKRDKQLSEDEIASIGRKFQRGVGKEALSEEEVADILGL